MKKRLSLILSVLLILGLFAGCNNNSGSGSSAPAGDSGSQGGSTAPAADGEVELITLKIGHNYDFVTIPDSVIEAADRLMERYANEGRNVQIEFETDYQRIDWTEYHNNLVFAAKSGDVPDIFSLDDDIYGFVNADMMLDITELIDDKFVEDIFTPYLVDGRAYGMPFDLPQRVIYFNKKGLAEIGWTDEEIAALPQQVAAGEFTFEQFIELAGQVQAEGSAQWGLAHRPGPGNDFRDILEVLGGRWYNEEGTMVFDEQGLTRFFQFTYDNANVTNITPPDLNQMGWDTINTMVGDGSVFAYYGPLYSSTYVAGAVNKTPEEFVEDVAFLLFPKGQYNDTPFAPVSPQGMGISKATAYPDVCLDLFKELADGSYDLLANHASTIFTLSSVKAANTHPAITENPVLKEVTYMADYGRHDPTVEGVNLYNSELHKQVVQLELGQTTPEQAVADMKIQMELGLGDAIIIE